MLCISPRRDLLVHDPADTASRLGIPAGDLHNPGTVSLPLLLCWDLRGGCRAAESEGAASQSALPTQAMKTASLSIRLAAESKPGSRRALCTARAALDVSWGTLVCAAFQQTYLPIQGAWPGGL